MKRKPSSYLTFFVIRANWSAVRILPMTKPIPKIDRYRIDSRIISMRLRDSGLLFISPVNVL
jgi:hypothetical protein